MALSLITQEATWLQLLLTQLELLKPEQQFAEIRVHKSKKYIDEILTLAKQY